MKLNIASSQPRLEAEALSSHPDLDRGPQRAVLILLGTTPSSTAARVACRASSTRAFFSFISISVAAPTTT